MLSGSKASAAKVRAAQKAAAAAEKEEADKGDSKIAAQSIRVNVETLENLMTMVSELVLTRNQLLEIVRRHEDSEFKVPLQRLSNVTAELQEGVMKTRMQPIGNAWQKLPRVVRDLADRARQEDRARDARRRDRARPPGAGPDQGSAHPHGAQLGRPRPRDARGAPPRRQVREGHDPPVRLSRRRPHHHRDLRRRTRPQHREDQGEGALPTGSSARPTRRRWPKRRSTSSSSRPASRPPPTVTSVSGRGVGMDVVKTNIDQIGGTVDVKSVYGEGIDASPSRSRSRWRSCRR